MGTSSHGFIYSFPGTRKSGDPNTTLGNSVLNAMSLLYTFCNNPRVGLDKVHIMINGDDAIISLNLPYEPANFINDTVSSLLELGFTAKMTSVTPEHATFCSARFVPCEGNVAKFLLTPKLGRAFVRFGYAEKAPKDRYIWLVGCATQWLTVFSHIPFMLSFANKIILLCRAVSPVNVDCTVIIEDYLRLRPNSARQPSPQLSMWLSAVYGITQEDIVEFNTLVDNLSLESCMDCQLLCKLVATDEC
jgi:hypothetical protein